MSEKDFLSKIAEENKKPDSFKEEERVKIQKEKKPLNPLVIIIPAVILVLLLIGVWFFFLRAKIDMPSFVGKTQTDVAKWVTQQGISKNGIIFDEEYNFDYDDGVIFYQSVEEGTKVKKDVKINFTVSMGADPDEKIKVPDIANMSKDELDKWVSDNKLSKTKVMTSYSDTVEKDSVISFEFKGCSADEFTRGCTLNISVSKGTAPEGTVQVEDFTKKSYVELEAWAKSKKINLEKVESFSNDIDSGMIISQSVAGGKTMKQNETLTVYVSKGKGIKVPNFSTMKNSEVDKWLEDNASAVNITKKYSNSDKYVISQSVSSGNMIGMEDKLDITLNMGNSFYLDDLGLSADSIVGMYYDRLVDWCNNNRSSGVDAFTGQWNENTEVYSETYSRGQIVSVKCEGYSDGKEYSCSGKLPLDVRFSVIISKGKVTDVDISKAKNEGGDFNAIRLADILATEKIGFNNYSNGSVCTLYINGVKITNTTQVIRYIEGESVELRESGATLDGVSTPLPSDKTGE